MSSGGNRAIVDVSKEEHPAAIPSALVQGPLENGPSIGYDDVLHITPLGAYILNATSLPSASLVLPAQPSRSTAHGPLVFPVISQAPCNQEHARLWADAINVAKQGGKSMDFDGVGATSPSFVTLNKASQLVEFPLSPELVDPDKEVVSTIVRAPSLTPPTFKTRPTQAGPGRPVQLVPTSAISIAGGTGSSKVADPTLQAPPPVWRQSELPQKTSVLTPHGFVLSGQIQLFGTIPARLYTFQGTAAQPVSEIVLIGPDASAQSEILSISRLLPFMKNTVLDDIMLKSAHLTYNGTNLPSNGKYGMWIEADIGLSGSLSDLAGDLTKLFGIPNTEMHIAAQLMLTREWTRVFDSTSLTIEATFLKLNKTFGIMQFTDVTITISTFTSSSRAGKKSLDWGFMGGVALSVAGSVAPLMLQYSMQKISEIYSLTMLMADAWDTAFGVQGLQLSQLVFQGNFSRQSNEAEIGFDVSAIIDLSMTTVELSGFYQTDKAWGFAASIENLSWEDLVTAYGEMFSGNLHESEHHDGITVSDLTLSVSSADTTIVLEGSVVVHGYTAAAATVTFNQHGIRVTGALENVKFDNLTIERASLDFYIGKVENVASGAAAGTTTYLTITGSVTICDSLIVSVGVHLGKDASTNGLQYVIYGELDGIHSIGTMAPAVKSAPDLDLPVSKMALIAASSETSTVSFANTFNYPVKKGLQLFATIASIQALNKVLQMELTNLTIMASITGDEIEVGILLNASNIQLSLSPNIKSGALAVGIDVRKGGTPTLFAQADFSVKVSGPQDHLDFSLRLDVNPKAAIGSAAMTSDWVNPMNISPQLMIGQLLVEVDITFDSLSTSISCGIKGHIRFDQFDAEVILHIGENPHDDLIILSMRNFGLPDIARLARLITQDEKIPIPPSGILEFQEFDLGISTGVNFQQVYYPPGVNFHTKMSIFGKKVLVKCVMEKSPAHVAMQGTLEAFSLGPLTVAGPKTVSNSTGPSLDVEFSSSVQHVLIAGSVELCGLSASVDVAVALNPLHFVFDLELAFVDTIQFSLHAEVIGDVQASHLQDSSGLDFTLSAKLEQKILQHLAANVHTALLAAKHTVDDSFDTAQKTFEAADKKFKQGVADAQKALDEKKAEWDKKDADTRAESEKRLAELKTQEESNAKAVEAAKKVYDSVIADLESKAKQASQDMNNVISSAQEQITKATNTETAKIDEAQQKLTSAQRDLANQFGDVDQQLQNAEHSVDDLQRQCDDIDGDIDRTRQDLNDLDWLDPNHITLAAKIMGLEAEKVGIESALGIAHRTLEAVRAVMNDVAYQAAKAAIASLSSAFDGVKSGSELVLSQLNKTLEARKSAATGLFNAANDALETARKAGTELNLWDTALAAMNAFDKTKVALSNAAHELVADLVKSAEWVAYEAASASLKLANVADAELSVATHAMQAAKAAADAFLDVTAWMVDHAGDLVDIPSVELSGSLRGLTGSGGLPLDAKVTVVLLGHNFVLELKFRPGDVVALVKSIFDECIQRLKKVL